MHRTSEDMDQPVTACECGAQAKLEAVVRGRHDEVRVYRRLHCARLFVRTRETFAPSLRDSALRRQTQHQRPSLSVQPKRLRFTLPCNGSGDMTKESKELRKIASQHLHLRKARAAGTTIEKEHESYLARGYKKPRPR